MSEGRRACEHTFSALLSNADIHHAGEQVADVPINDRRNQGGASLGAAYISESAFAILVL